VGSFSHQFTGLPNNSQIFYRAKAYNLAGWGYGGEQNFWTWNATTSTDSGAGSDIGAVPQIGFTVADAGAGAEAAEPGVLFSVSDVGAGSEQGSIGLTLQDAGAGQDSLLDIGLEMSDVGSAVEIWDISVSFSLGDSGAAADLWTIGEVKDVIDAGVGTDQVLSILILLEDSGAGSDSFSMEAQINIADAVAGSDVVDINVSFTMTDAGSAVDNWIPVEAAVTVDESGIGTDVVASLTVSFTISDQGALTGEAATIWLTQADFGAAVDAWMLASEVPIADNGVGQDIIFSVVAAIPVSDAGSGADLRTITGLIVTLDAGAATEKVNVMLTPLILYDTAIGVEIVYRNQGLIRLDVLDLPHVQRIHVGEPTLMSSKLVSGELPHREFLGKMGRTIEIQGWTDSLARLDQIKALVDGNAHLLTLPTGDSLSVHVTDARDPRETGDWAGGIYRYALTAVERMD
jgi:hypothetical protein